MKNSLEDLTSRVTAAGDRIRLHNPSIQQKNLEKSLKINEQKMEIILKQTDDNRPFGINSAGTTEEVVGY